MFCWIKKRSNKVNIKNKSIVYTIFTMLLLIFSSNSQTIILENFNEVGETEITLTSTVTPNSFYIGQFPNSIKPFTSFYFGVPREQHIKITITDLLGKEIATVTTGNFKAGVYKAEFDTSLMSSGVYLYRLESSEYTEIKKFTVII